MTTLSETSATDVLSVSMVMPGKVHQRIASPVHVQVKVHVYSYKVERLSVLPVRKDMEV